MECSLFKTQNAVYNGEQKIKYSCEDEIKNPSLQIAVCQMVILETDFLPHPHTHYDFLLSLYWHQLSFSCADQESVFRGRPTLTIVFVFV